MGMFIILSCKVQLGYYVMLSAAKHLCINGETLRFVHTVPVSFGRVTSYFGKTPEG
jgi:hypothetical protein